jgi:hypothetical protein
MTTKLGESVSNYALFRGKCKEFCEEAIKNDPSLTLVRGYYYCPLWNTDEPHWWTTRPDGTIYDPTALQFGSKGMGIYTPFNGIVSCSECGKEVKEEDADIDGNYCFCSTKCHCRFVGL